MSRRLLLVHAHPDDETIGTGATMARYASEGVQVTLVTCTLGEEGEVLLPELAHLAADQDDALGAHRQTELAAAMAEKVHLPVKGVIENMSWFAGDDGKRYEIFGSGGGQELATELDVPLLGQIPLLPRLREGGDDGRPITAVDPESEAAGAFRAIAERIAVELRPKKVFNAQLKIN